MARLHVDVDYCTDYHNNSWNCNSIVFGFVPVIPVFVDAPCMRVMLVSDDCSFELEFAFVVGPDLFLEQHLKVMK